MVLVNLGLLGGVVKLAMKTILITGINGFLGGHLAKMLSSYYAVIGIARTPNFIDENYSIKVYTPDQLEKIFEENTISGVIHTATVYGRGHESIEAILLTNVILPLNIYELCKKFKTNIFINTDTFFNNPQYKYQYLPGYTLSKKQVWEWLKLIAGECKLVNMKLFHLYGPGDSKVKFVTSILSNLKENKEEINLTQCNQTRDFIYVSDAVNAYKILLDKSGELQDMISEFELGTGIETSVKEFMNTAKEISNSSSKLNFGALPYRENEIMNSKATVKPLLDLGWRPEYSIPQGIKNIFQSMEL